MVATVNASTSAGVVITPDNSGVLAFQSSSATALTIDASQNSTFVGTASATKLIPTGSSATGNGLYLPAANSLGLSTNGTNAVYIDSSQNVGIGTTPSSWGSGIPVIQTTSGYVYGSVGNSRNAYYNGTNWKYISAGSYATLYQGGDNHTWSVTTSTQGANNNITWNAAMTLDSSGNVGIGTTSPATNLHVVGQIRTSGTTAQAIYIYGAPSTAPYITINQYGVRSWDVGAGYYSSGTFSIQSNQVNGVYLGGTATSWASASDERFKDIIEPINNALTKVNGLRSVIGKYKTDEEGVRRSFLIAQDIQTQFPEALESSDPDKLGVQYTDVIPLLVASIKELKAINDTLTARIVALENR